MFRNIRDTIVRQAVAVFLCAAVLVLVGCNSEFRRYRIEGRQAMTKGQYKAARDLLLKAAEHDPADTRNLYDIAVCSEHAATEHIQAWHHVAARRELEQAAAYYDRVLMRRPAMQAAMMGKNRVLELQGRLAEALEDARWASRNLGPSAKQQIFLAEQLEERGDLDGALLHYRQAVAMEPTNARAHERLGEFLSKYRGENSSDDQP